MSKSAVTDWSATADANTDIDGIDINENCPAGGINNAIRALMAQITVWIASTLGPVIKVAANTVANNLSILDGLSTPVARLIGYRGIPLAAKTAAYQIALGDVGQGVSITTGGITVPLNATVAFAVGDTVAIYNNSASSQTITAAGAVTLRLVGTATTGNRTLAQRGICTLLKVGTDEWIASGGGVS